MNIELLAMAAGSASGFIMKLIGTQVENQTRLFERMIQSQELADDSADRASDRGGAIMRRFITCIIMFAIVVAPFVVAFSDIGVSVQRETPGFFGLFKSVKWDTVQGFVILPEVRQTALAIVGFYFGSSQIK